jgi:hypothetical protein
VRQWKFLDPGTPAMRLDPSAPQGRRLFSAEHPQANHNAGDMSFGPDGLLYVTDGDGGGADDQDCQTNFDGNPMFGHPAPGNGQAVDTPLGKMLRIDPWPDGTYAIPAGNPFASGGPAGALPEIFAFGLRNPFRFSFDAATGDLWVADVGQNDLEEVDLARAGQNFGWHVKEGTFLFDPGGFQLKGARSDGFPFRERAGQPRGAHRSRRAVRPRRGHRDHRRLRLPRDGHARAARLLRLRRHVAAPEQPPRPAVRV